ncbi:NACHT, LRR and PYD domains-containing protein 12-like isoform X2 [Phascolarctos cinereus]|uniref:NACHT, LRR and PYD domains-containing protein 12-like isoform X2 n=1 Tax=Phascolarctos cinereus TaxID=38626 RepID=A0A6P5IXQ6_PHACI|nr:NACHT, LRR and PYD domains-containing protein 12-like isoform X2 [Phascolarctos cinereus]
MAEGVRCQLVRHLEHLTSEELKKFKLYLVDHLPRGCLEGADLTKVADLLVSSLGQQEAWETALSTWEKMGQRELWERARKEDLGLVPDPILPASSDERNKYQERMRKKFQLMRDRNSRPGEHELFHHRFTQLLLVPEYRCKEQKQRELLVQRYEHAKIMEERGQIIEVSALFDPDKKTGTIPHTVVLQGGAGIGKTTLAIKVILEWAEGKLYQDRFDYVFYLTCRELNHLGEREFSFAYLIANDWPGPYAPMTEILSQPERLLFIIDGLDELKFPCDEHRYDLCKDWKQQRPVPILLSSLLRKTMLPEASLLLTARLTALGKFIPLLENPRHVEILGFSAEHRKEYFCKFFRNKNLGKRAFSLLKGNGALFTMCSVPLMDWIVCTCLKQQMEKGRGLIQALKTTTALYVCYISLITPNDKNFISQHLRGLCRLAAEGFWGRKMLFEEEDLRRHNLEAADVSAFLDMNIFQKDIDRENYYSFIHLSFHEFFAAMFYVMNTEKEGEKNPDSSIPDVKKLLEKCSRYEARHVILALRFLFGFLNAETAKKLERKFRCRMSQEIKSRLLQWIERETKRDIEQPWFSTSNVPKWHSLLYEIQNAEFVTQMLVNIQEITVNIHYPYEALSAIYCMKRCPGAQRLSMLEGCKVTYSFCRYLFSASCLKSLHFSNISFVDDGRKLSSKTLGQGNCQLQTLSFMFCRLTHRCYQNVFSALSSNKSLKNLDLSGNSFEEGGIKLLCKVLENQNCKLETLRLTHCKLSSACCQDLFTTLTKNESLKELYLSHNYFGKYAMKHLCEALGNHNCKLHTVRLIQCNLTATGVQDLLPVMCSNENLKMLDLSSNFFRDEGMKLLCEALEKQTVKLQTLNFWQDYLSEESERALTSLQARTSFHITWEEYHKAEFFDWDAEDTV